MSPTPTNPTTTPIDCAEPGCTWAVRGVPDKYARIMADHHAAEHAGQAASTETETAFGSPDCTCIPWTRQGGAPRLLGPGDTVDQISGWERGLDCPYHAPHPAGSAETARRRLTPSEHDRAWHAIEGSAGEEDADPGTVLNAVLHALRIDAPTAAEEQAASPSRRVAAEAQQPAPAETETVTTYLLEHRWPEERTWKRGTPGLGLRVSWQDRTKAGERLADARERYPHVEHRMVTVTTTVHEQITDSAPAETEEPTVVAWSSVGSLFCTSCCDGHPDYRAARVTSLPKGGTCNGCGANIPDTPAP